MDNTRLSKSPEETIEVAKELAIKHSNALVLLYGSLGAGKTHFAKGFARGLNINQTVSSPSYTLINEYRENNLTMFHIDLYRINCFEEIIDIGLFEILNTKSPCLIEWPDKVEELQKLPHLMVKITDCIDNDENHRQISWKWNGDQK